MEAKPGNAMTLRVGNYIRRGKYLQNISQMKIADTSTGRTSRPFEVGANTKVLCLLLTPVSKYTVGV